MKRALLFVFLLTGCESIGDFADDMGSHLPTIGERCEHWQCMTGEGQRISEENKRARAAAANTPPSQ